LEVWPSGQWQQTVNLPGFALRRFESSRLHHSLRSRSLDTRAPVRGSNSGVESQPSKLLVAGSNPVSRSIPLSPVPGLAMAGGAARHGSGPFWVKTSRHRNEDFSDGRQGPFLGADIRSLDRQQTDAGPAEDCFREALQREDLSPRDDRAAWMRQPDAWRDRSLWVRPLWASMGERSSRKGYAETSSRFLQASRSAFFGGSD
jgi:hypothetical protein